MIFPTPMSAIEQAIVSYLEAQRAYAAARARRDSLHAALALAVATLPEHRAYQEANAAFELARDARDRAQAVLAEAEDKGN